MARYARIKGRLRSQTPTTGFPCPDLPSVGERHHLYTREPHGSKTQKKVTKGRVLQGTTYHQNTPRSRQDSILEPLSAVKAPRVVPIGVDSFYQPPFRITAAPAERSCQGQPPIRVHVLPHQRGQRTPSAVCSADRQTEFLHLQRKLTYGGSPTAGVSFRSKCRRISRSIRRRLAGLKIDGRGGTLLPAKRLSRGSRYRAYPPLRHPAFLARSADLYRICRTAMTTLLYWLFRFGYDRSRRDASETDSLLSIQSKSREALIRCFL